MRRISEIRIVLALLLVSVARGENEVNVARRWLSGDTVRRAQAVAAPFLAVLLANSLIENGRLPLADVLFECASATGAVGVSSIGTPNPTSASCAISEIYGTYGGVAVDLGGYVLNEKEGVVPALYACGKVADSGDFHETGAYAGGLGPALTMGTSLD